VGVAAARRRPDLGDSELLAAVRGVQRHAGRGDRTGRPWRDNDTRTMAELGHRCWNWARVEGLKLVGVPRCVENLLHHVTATGRRMHRAVWRPLVGAVCAAYRAKTLGVRLSLEQVAVLLQTSRRTAARVVRELVEARLLRRTHTYQCDEGGRERVYDTSVYSVGPALLAHVRGGLETGARGDRWGAAARARSKRERRERYLALWNAQRGTRGPSFAEKWLGGGASVAGSLGGSDNVAPTPSNSGGHKQSGPPDCGEIKNDGRSQRATPAPLRVPSAPETRQEPSAARGPAARRAFFGSGSS
jgi:hypothetical protein